MSAVINGVLWTATCITTSSNAGGIVSLGASDGQQSVGLSITAAGLGTYTMTPLDPKTPPPPDLKFASGLVILLPTSGATWVASPGTPGSSGTLTLTGLTTTGVAGTFSFTAAATAGGAAGMKIVSNGGFNITF